MRSIRKRIYIYANIFALSAIACFLLINSGVASLGVPAYLLLAVFISAGAGAAILGICERRRLNIARLITDNAILHIRTAEIRDVSETAKKSTDTGTEVFVSYFGILLDSRLIKFNQEGIRLLDVVFGPDYVSLTYGTDKQRQNTRLLHPVIPSAELCAIAEKFRYETGVMPDICC